MADDAINAGENNAQNADMNNAQNQGADGRDVENLVPANNAQNGDADDAQNLLLGNNAQNPPPTNRNNVQDVLTNNGLNISVNNAKIQLPQMNLALT